MKSILVVILIFSVSLFFVGCGSSDNHKVSTLVYKGIINYNINGDVGTYNVSIRECNYKNDSFRIVRLTRLSDDGTIYRDITGHDWGCDGVWDHVFYHDGVNSFVNGCDFVVWEKSGNWRFKKTLIKEERSQAFTSDKLFLMQTVLDQAVIFIRSPAYMVDSFSWN